VASSVDDGHRRSLQPNEGYAIDVLTGPQDLS
jgi:hypothetical protein